MLTKQYIVFLDLCCYKIFKGGGAWKCAILIVLGRWLRVKKWCGKSTTGRGGVIQWCWRQHCWWWCRTTRSCWHKARPTFNVRAGPNRKSVAGRKCFKCQNLPNMPKNDWMWCSPRNDVCVTLCNSLLFSMARCVFCEYHADALGGVMCILYILYTTSSLLSRQHTTGNNGLLFLQWKVYLSGDIHKCSYAAKKLWGEGGFPALLCTPEKAVILQSATKSWKANKDNLIFVLCLLIDINGYGMTV